MVSISISGLKATSGSGEQMSALPCQGHRGFVRNPAIGIKTFHVLRCESSDRGHMAIECSHLRELSSL